MDRREYKLSNEDIEKIKEASTSLPLIAIHCGNRTGDQERANLIWKGIGERLGFRYLTVEPSPKGDEYFTAVPTFAPSVPANERKAPELKAGDLFADLDIGRRGRLYRVVMIVTKETHPDVREATAVCLTRGKVTNVAVRRLLHASRFERVKEGNTEKGAWEAT